MVRAPDSCFMDLEVVGSIPAGSTSDMTQSVGCSLAKLIGDESLGESGKLL